MLRFDLLQTPHQDGEVLIEPAASLWPGLIEEAVRRRAISQVSLRLAGIPVQIVRGETRQRLFSQEIVEPVVACGHQPEFIHPGVWAKHVVVHHVAKAFGLVGVDLVVDNDAPRSPGLAVPAVDAEGYITRRMIPVHSGTAGSAYEGRSPLSPSGIESLLRGIQNENDAAPRRRPPRRVSSDAAKAGDDEDADRSMMARDSSMIAEYCRGLGSTQRPRDFVDQHLAGRGRVDRPLGADLQERRISEAFDGPFVADILLDLERFAHQYNDALAEYRRDQRVRSPDRPLPDLRHEAGRSEAPFWIYQPHEQRRRLWIAQGSGEAIDVYAGDQLAGSLSRADLLRNAPAALASLAPWVIRPRALTLTLWARLLVCDFFVHGIGGAKYDRITDGIFRRYYRCEPPPYGCVTATLRLPLPRQPAGPADLVAARRRVRDLHFNPQRYLEEPPLDLVAVRQQLIDQSNALREQRADGLVRRSVFHAIREVNGRLYELAGDLARRFLEELAHLQRQVESNQIANSREFFYALQPRSRLDLLAGRLIESAQSVAVQA